MRDSKCLIVEPFYGGSHRQLIDYLQALLPSDSVDLFVLPAKKWHWRARTSALHFAQEIPFDRSYSVLFCSSVLNVAELVALRPDLAKTKKVVYFHENQLQYPVQRKMARDFQYGYNQILTALTADVVVFNSAFNRSSFLDSINSFFKLQPDHRPKGLKEKIDPKTEVAYFPLAFPPRNSEPKDDSVLHILWPHRWEHDKNPEAFFACLEQLKSEGFNFKLSVLGESYSEIPEAFTRAHETLSSHIVHWGFRETKAEYFSVLQQCHVVVSTAFHEFFGVAMLEAAWFGCFPLVPQRLVYPEIFPSNCIYRTDQQLFKRLRDFCKCPRAVPKDCGVDFTLYSGKGLEKTFLKMFDIVEENAE